MAIPTTANTTRGIARAAVRDELARLAFDMFGRDGFENVTINDLAAAANVSRSTFLRYFGSKEEAVLGALDADVDQIAETVRARPSRESDWVALRHGVDFIMERYRKDPEWSMRITRLILETPALRNRHYAKRQMLGPILSRALADRTDPNGPVTLAAKARAAAALDCLHLAIEAWMDSDGRENLEELIDEAFATLKHL